MKLKKAVTTITVSTMLLIPLAQVNQAFADEEADAASINAAAKKYNYGGTSYLHKILKTQGIKYNCFYANGNKIKYRKGKPEGIVIHETATPKASAYNEAIYFNRAWRSMYSYVHAFIDHKGVIQMMTTKYGVWGGGPKANNRFIQLELCQESSRANFAKSVNNDAIFAAKMLHKYHLKPSNATKTGKGTVWSHHAVTRFLGGTNHTDPDGYFAKWGYSMDKFYSLIKYYYDLQGGNTSPSNTPNDNPSPAPNNSNDAQNGAVGNPTPNSTEPTPVDPNNPNTTSSDTVSQAPSRAKTLMHDAYTYDEKGRRTTSSLKTAGTQVIVGGEQIINGKKYLQIGTNEYVVASNVNGNKRKLTRNAYVYDTAGKRSGNTKLLKASVVQTYGGQVLIQGTGYFQISPTEFVKASNF
ncbi:SLAP domain-containing protein [Lactobacillus sp. ESL0791]|uniref:SLAP domain-containing protein n=1 Tax=Lactobacillus sp. ESL0791 TaxID=2983234 RepID=UPI0023F84667|nr:SLAP domain-containing protein [Lactobacillus sp. ESL0791]MDF7638187.1 SLAP domain-containing protein [Lactobacillus sp. ESL0791]